MEEDFFIKDILDNGITVEYWDLTQIYFNHIQIADTIERPYIKKYQTLSSVKHEIDLQNLDTILFCPLLTYDILTLKLFRLLTKNNCKLCFFDRRGWPNISPIHPIKILEYFISYKKIGRVIKILWCKLSLKLGLIKSYDLVFVSGELEKKKYNSQTTKIVGINHFDYDQYLRCRTLSERMVSERYAVFLDEYLPYHPDAIMFKTPVVDPKKYYASLNRFFSFIENHYHIKVIIAAHPKANYESNPFESRPIFKYKTPELVKDSEFVMAHVSTSISYGVLFQKLIFYIYTNEYRSLYLTTYFSFLLQYAKLLDGMVINITTIEKEKDLPDMMNLKINKQKYKDYMINILTTNHSKNTLSKDIVIKSLKSDTTW